MGRYPRHLAHRAGRAPALLKGRLVAESMKKLLKLVALPSALALSAKVAYDSFDPSLFDGAGGFLAGAICTLIIVVCALVSLRHTRFDLFS